ncbi:hypothetical protein BY996DRAFT_6560334 [Phakopsora pachyrhizi]|nr:hypothetical protein BY996DRAFT_6560334 [Phakopsora pachyrhizi]
MTIEMDDFIEKDDLEGDELLPEEIREAGKHYSAKVGISAFVVSYEANSFRKMSISVVRTEQPAKSQIIDEVP